MSGRKLWAALTMTLGCAVALSGGYRGLAASPAASGHFNGQQFDIPDPATGGRGGAVYLNNCAGCHDTGVDRAPQRRMFSYMSPQSIYHALAEGRMKAQGAALSNEDKVAVAEFVSRQKIGDAKAVAEPPVCRDKAAKFDFGEPPVLQGWGFEPTNQRFVPARIAGLSKAQAGRLQLKWAVAFPNAVNVRSAPAIAGGALYVGSHNGGVYAIDRETGCARWTFQAGAEVRTGIIVSPWKKGDATAKPLLYFGDFVGNAYAVDAQTGKLVWRVKADPHPNATITGTPTLYGDRLYVPLSSMEGLLAADPHFECCTFRGAIVALDAATGKEQWKTFMTDTPVIVGKNAVGADQYGPSGAPIWNSPAIDVQRHQIYVGTGENYSSPANDRSDSIVAMDLATGRIKWVYQALALDAMNLGCVAENTANCPKEHGPDYDFGAAVILATAANGKQLVIGGQKSGYVHAVDPDSGRLIWKAKPGRGGMLGGVHFGMAANGDAVFVPVNDALEGTQHAEPAKPGIYALDLATGKSLWAAASGDDNCGGAKPCFPGYSQAITATPDLVFAGSVSGWLRAFDAQSGAMLWQYDAKVRVKIVNGGESAGGSFGGGAGPVLYDGVLFASSGYSLAGATPGNVLLAFEAK